MLVNLNDVLVPARRDKYAVGLFNAVNLEMARGIIEAAEETGSPVIMGTAEILLPYGPLEDLSYFLIPMAKRAKVPVVVCTLRNTHKLLNNVLHLRHTDIHLHLLDVITVEEQQGMTAVELGQKAYAMMAEDLGPELVWQGEN